MGVDLNRWTYQWQPAEPPRVAFYGGLASPQNERAVLTCREHVMPAIWRVSPRAEFWIVGSNPSHHVRALARDPRVHVTGFVDAVQPLLATMSAVVCPWTRSYGFRSRLVEVMALGVPVVATSAAVDGMDLQPDRGLFLTDRAADLAPSVIRLLTDGDFARMHSRLARQQVEGAFSLDATYGALARDLREWLQEREPRVATA
jgi:glycosyltransferase involved in cell wall biosynthesis